MPKRSAPASTTLHAVDSGRTLYELGTRELWQKPVLARDGRGLGLVIRQIIEPEAYTVRYLVVYDPTAGRHFLIPASVVTDIDVQGILCDISADQAHVLPAFAAHLERTEEFDIYAALNRTPHWIEESAVDRTDPH